MFSGPELFPTFSGVGVLMHNLSKKAASITLEKVLQLIYLQTWLKISFDEIVGAHSKSQLKEELLFFLLENA